MHAVQQSRGYAQFAVKTCMHGDHQTPHLLTIDRNIGFQGSVGVTFIMSVYSWRQGLVNSGKMKRFQKNSYHVSINVNISDLQ